MVWLDKPLASAISRNEWSFLSVQSAEDSVRDFPLISSIECVLTYVNVHEVHIDLLFVQASVFIATLNICRKHWQNLKFVMLNPLKPQ
jgi:hypothetical protein